MGSSITTCDKGGGGQPKTDEVDFYLLIIQVNIKGGTCLSAVHGVAVLPKYYCPILSLLLDHALSVTSMSASIGQ